MRYLDLLISLFLYIKDIYLYRVMYIQFQVRVLYTKRYVSLMRFVYLFLSSCVIFRVGVVLNSSVLSYCNT